MPIIGIFWAIRLKKKRAQQRFISTMWYILHSQIRGITRKISWRNTERPCRIIKGIKESQRGWSRTKINKIRLTLWFLARISAIISVSIGKTFLIIPLLRLSGIYWKYQKYPPKKHEVLFVEWKFSISLIKKIPQKAGNEDYRM